MFTSMFTSSVGCWPSYELKTHLLVQPDREDKVRLVIHNPSHEAKILGDAVHMGSAQLCDDPLAVQAVSLTSPLLILFKQHRGPLYDNFLKLSCNHSGTATWHPLHPN